MSGMRGLFDFALTPEQQRERVRQLVAAGTREDQVAELIGWDLNDVRRALAEPAGSAR